MVNAPKTPVDLAHKKMIDAPQNDEARLLFYHQLANQELFLLLTEEATEESINPASIDVNNVPYLLAFDLEERLTDYTGHSAPYAALPGRVIADMISNQPVGLAINLNVAPSAILVPPAAISWLTDMLTQNAEENIARPLAFSAPRLHHKLLHALGEKLAHCADLIDEAWLLSAKYSDGREEQLLAFINVSDNHKEALVRGVNETVVFCNLENQSLDVAFFQPDDEIVKTIQSVGTKLDIKIQPNPSPKKPVGPGRDPTKPPILR